MRNGGKFVVNFKDGRKEAEMIKSTLFINVDDYGQVKNMFVSYRLQFRILIGSLILRE